MRKKLFDESTTFEVIEGIKHRLGPPPVPGSKNQTRQKMDCKKLYTMIFTNGEVIYNGEKVIYDNIDLSNYGISDNKLNLKLIKFYDVIDEINVYNVQVKNSDYVVKVLVGEEFLRGTHSAGLYHVIQNTEIYVKDLRDRESSRCVKEIIKMLNLNNINLFGFDYPKIDFENENSKSVVKKRKKERI